MGCQFKTQLITGILSCPVIYIQTSHYCYVDEVLLDIISPKDGLPSGLDLSFDNLFEYDLVRGIVRFEDKSHDEDSESTDSSIAFLKNHLGCDDALPQISLIKNCGNLLQDSNEISTLLSYIASGYEGGRLHSLSTVILVSPLPIENLSREIIDVVKVIEIPIPKFEEIESIVKQIPISKQVEFIEDSVRLEFSRNLQGLRLADIRQILRSTLIRTGGRLSRQTISLALDEKKQIVKKTGIIEVVDTDERLENVGGLENLIEEIKKKKIIFDNLSLAQSKEASVPLPKGILLIGMPGCGKSMIAKSIAAEFNVALLRLDVNRLMGKYVGESETNLRRALETAEAAHPCVLWIDEIEKAFAGTDSGNNDIIIRLMGHFLTWMQERTSAVYVVATANDALKPELMRKGRFDDVFFIDFPNKKEAKSILLKTISRFSATRLYDWSVIDDGVVDALVEQMFTNAPKGFSGSEISALVGTVVENAFRLYTKQLSENDCKKPSIVQIKPKDFEVVISEIKDFVMSKQLVSTTNESGAKKKDSVILRISKLREEFSLRPASKQ